MGAKESNERAILRKCFPMLVSQINRNNGIMLWRDVVITWGQAACELAVAEEVIKKIILKKAVKPGVSPPNGVTAAYTSQWNQEQPKWL